MGLGLGVVIFSRGQNKPNLLLSGRGSALDDCRNLGQSGPQFPYM